MLPREKSENGSLAFAWSRVVERAKEGMTSGPNGSDRLHAPWIPQKLVAGVLIKFPSKEHSTYIPTLREDGAEHWNDTTIPEIAIGHWAAAWPEPDVVTTA